MFFLYLDESEENLSIGFGLVCLGQTSLKGHFQNKISISSGKLKKCAVQKIEFCSLYLADSSSDAFLMQLST